MNRFRNFIAISAFSLLVLGLPAIASAQYGDRDDDSYGRGRANNDRYGNNGYNRNIRGTIQSLKNKTRNLEQRSDRIDNRNDDRYNGRRGDRYNNLEQLMDRFRSATDDLENAYGRGRNLNNSEDEARRVLDIGSQIDQEIGRSRNRRMPNQWNQIQNDLRIIAQAYNLNYSRNRNWRDRLPF